MKIKQWITPGRVVYALIAAAPFIIGAAGYSRMPEQMPIHWNGAGEPDNYASKAFALLGLPAFILALNVFVQVVIAHDPKREGLRRAKAMLWLVKWLLAALPLFVQIITIAHVLAPGRVNVGLLVSLAMGLLLTAVGNYLPKCPPNYTVGIRLPWTLADENNWRKTHRLGGYVMMAGGLILTVMSLTPWRAWAAAVIPVMVLAPCGYSFYLFRKNKKGE